MMTSLKKLIPAPLRDHLRNYRFRWPPAIVPCLPGSSLHYGPPRSRTHVADYFARTPDALREVLPPHPIRLAEPVVHGEVPSRFLTGRHEIAPPGRLFHLRDARLLGPEGWIVASDDTWLADSSFEPAASNRPVSSYTIYSSRRGRAKPLRHLPGRTLSLASDYAIGGFGHFIHDSLARLTLVAGAGLAPGDFDWVYLPRIDSPTVNQLLARLSVPPERLLDHDPRHDLCCEHLTATSFPGHPGHLSPPYADYLRAAFAPRPQRRDRRLHLSRRGARRNYANTAEVDAVLNARGFEEVLPHKDPDMLLKATEASFIFSLEGANFFNALFAPAGTRTLLVFPDRLSHDIPYALSMSGAARHELHVMSARTLGPAGIDGGSAPVYLDPKTLGDALDAMGALPL